MGLHRCHDQTAGSQSVHKREYRDIGQQRLCQLRPTLFVSDTLPSDEDSNIGNRSNGPDDKPSEELVRFPQGISKLWFFHGNDAIVA